MQAIEIAALRDAIVQLLREAPGNQLLGAVLGNRLRARTGRTVKDYGFPNLGELVRRHMAADVKVIDHPSDLEFVLTAGSAALTGAATGEPPGTASPVSDLTADLRKVWKSPRSPIAIVVRRTDGAVHGRPRGTAVAGDEVELLAPSADDHKTIARRFIDAHVPEEHRPTFAEKLDSEEGAWWVAWDDLFRDRGPHLRDQWLRFRETELFALLDDALRKAGLADDAVTYARAAIDRSRSQGASRPRIAVPIPVSSGGLRRALVLTIERMSDDELRRVWVPAGLLYDALEQKR